MVAKTDGKDFFRSEYTQGTSLVAMIHAADKVGLLGGVAFVLVKNRRRNSGDIKCMVLNANMVRQPFGREVEAINPGTNYFGVAMGMLGYMLVRGENSGTNLSVPKGESQERGGLIKSVGEYDTYVGFAGGTEDENERIAQLGMVMLFPDIG